MARSLGLLTVLLLAVVGVRCINDSNETKTLMEESKTTEIELSGPNQVFVERQPENKVTEADGGDQQQKPAEYHRKVVEFHVDYTDPGANTRPNSSAPPGSKSLLP